MTTRSDDTPVIAGLAPSELGELESRPPLGQPIQAAEQAPTAPDVAIVIRDLNAFYGTRRVIRDVSMDIRANAITAIIGPSGSGKSTLLRCLDRMHEVVAGARSTGKITYRGADIYDPAVE